MFRAGFEPIDMPKAKKKADNAKQAVTTAAKEEPSAETIADYVETAIAKARSRPW